jgi:rRNA biogenesis protein RRP5
MAQMEYRNGFLERGKTCFDSLLSNNPKRLDIWNIYLDEHVKAYTSGASVDLGRIRDLFERAISLGMKPQKTEFFFKRWVEVEEQYGGEAGQAAVRERAVAYVNSIQGADAAAVADQEDQDN